MIPYLRFLRAYRARFKMSYFSNSLTSTILTHLTRLLYGLIDRVFVVYHVGTIVIPLKTEIMMIFIVKALKTKMMIIIPLIVVVTALTVNIKQVVLIGAVVRMLIGVLQM